MVDKDRMMVAMPPVGISALCYFYYALFSCQEVCRDCETSVSVITNNSFLEQAEKETKRKPVDLTTIKMKTADHKSQFLVLIQPLTVASHV